MASIYDAILAGTFADPAMQMQGWGEPRLPKGQPGLPSPSPGAGMSYEALQALGGWQVDPRTGKLAYAAPMQQEPAPSPRLPDPVIAYAPQSAANPAASAAASMARPTASSVDPLAGVLPNATAIPRAQVPGYEMGDGLISLLTGGKTNGLSGLLSGMGEGGLLGLLGGGNRPQRTVRPISQVQMPSQQYDTANREARAKASQKIGGSRESGNSSGNLGGVSSSGRRYDYDRNKWV